MTAALPATPASFDAALATVRQKPLPQDFRGKEAAKEFEAVFLSEMLSHMFGEAGADPAFGGGPGEDMFRGMLVQEYAKKMAGSQSIGIAAQLQKMIIQMQQQP